MRPDLPALARMGAVFSTVVPSSSTSTSARNRSPTFEGPGRIDDSNTPFGSRAPAARQVHVPSGRALVNSISILRDIVGHATRLNRTLSTWYRYRCRVPIYALGDQVPDIHPDAYIHPDAVIIGSVHIGALSTVWPCAVLRGDDGEIFVGDRTSIQDGSVLHTTPHNPTRVGNDCVIGHIVHLEACTIEDRVLIGNGSIVLHEVVVQTGSVVAANSVLLDGTIVPSGALAAGVPAVIKPGKAKIDFIDTAVQKYIEKGHRFKASLRRID